MNVIFVSGMLRSGSTLLSRLLGQHPEIFAAGELANFWRSLHRDAHCQCGSSVAACTVWSGVRDDVKRASGLDSQQVESLRLHVARNRNVRGSRRAMVSGGGSSAQKEYAAVRALLLGAIRERTGASVVVDTSKSAVEAFFVNTASHALNVHIMRNPYDVAASETDDVRFAHLPEGDRPPVRSASRSALMWSYFNLQAARVISTADTSLPPLQLEQLIEHPCQILDKIVAAAGLAPFTWRHRNRDFYFPAGHIVNGNPSRNNTGWQPVRSSTDGAKLTTAERAAVAILARRVGF